MDRRFNIVLFLAVSITVCWGDDPDSEKAEKRPAEKQPTAEAGEVVAPVFELTEEVREVLVPLFSSIAKADVSRATVEMLADSVIGGTVVESQKSTYQIASVHPDKFTVYLKETEQRTRVYCDGKSMAVAVASDAFFRLPDAISMQDAVSSMPVPMGPYPEPVFALTLAGVDPAVSFVAGMRSIEVIDRNDFRGKIPSVHLKGVQADSVTWDFWISKDDHKPLRLLVDLTPMLIASEDVQVPEGFSYQVRFDFLSWRVTGEVGEGLFTYKPAEDAKEYESLQDYYDSVAGAAAEHPLLGEPAPPFKTVTLAGKKVDSKKLAGKVIVLDFWATWCTPCLAAMPILKEITDEYADKDAVFLAMNTGEEKQAIADFLKEQKLEINPVLDPDGKIADAFSADAIPLTVVIGKSGVIESVHIGFPGEEALKQRLTDELDVLCVGGKIASAKTEKDE